MIKNISALSFTSVKDKDSCFRFLSGRKTFTWCCLLFSILVYGPEKAMAQDDPQFSQNMYNRLPVNPGYAGSTGSMCATSLIRNQWVGFEGAPISQNFAFDALVEPLHGGLGFALTHDQLGFTNSLNFKVAYAYRMRLSNSGRLAFGLSGGFMQRSLDLTQTINSSDDPLPLGSYHAIAPDFDFGVYYNTSDFYMGASVTHINAAKLSYVADNGDAYEPHINRHYYFMGGYNYALNRIFTLKPSFFFKTDGTSQQTDINLTVLYNNSLWLGVSYRTSDAVILMAGINVTNELKVGYSYDITTSLINTASSGSHELMLRYCFKIKNNRPAYMNRNVRFL